MQTHSTNKPETAMTEKTPISLKPYSNEGLHSKFKELSAFAEVTLNSLLHKKNMTYSEEEILYLMLSKLEDLTDHYEQLAGQNIICTGSALKTEGQS